MNIQTPTSIAGSIPTAPYTVDTSAGGHSGIVSAQWAARPADQRFNDLTSLHAFKKKAHDESWEQRFKTNTFEAVAPELRRVEDMNVLKVQVPNVRSGGDVARDLVIDPTNWAFTQLCQLSKSPAGFLRELPSQMVADALNWRMRHARDVEEVKLYGSPSELWAATGPSYGRINDHEIVAALMNIAGNGLGQDGFHWKTPGRLNWMDGTYDPEAIGPASDHTFYASDRDLFVFLVDDRRPIVIGKTRDGRDDHLMRGFYLQNSMVGSKLLRLAAFYLRGSCANRCLWGVEGFQEITIRHTSLAPDRWLEECRPALESFASGSDRTLIEGVQKAKAKQVVSKDEEAVKFLQARNFSMKAAQAIMHTHLKEEGTPIRSAWDMAQGITAAARSKLNTDDRIRDELEAKKVLDAVA